MEKNKTLDILAEQCYIKTGSVHTDYFDYVKYAELIVRECADYIRENLDSSDAEPLAWTMEVKYGVHGDYA